MRRGAQSSATVRLGAAERALREARERSAPREGEGISHAAEWLLDNQHVIQAALREVAEDLPGSFYRKLPRVPSGEARVAEVARQAWEGRVGPIDLERVRRFLEESQETEPLTIGEIWALPALLRLEALEDLAAAAAGGDPATPLTGEEAATQVGEAVLSLRALAAADWMAFFEKVSLVEAELRRDPAGAYAGMDFETRDRYRQAVEDLSRGSGRPELEVVREAARLGAAGRAGGRERHIGFYLVDAGRPVLAGRLGYRAPLRTWAGRWARRHPALVYLGSVLVLTAGALALALSLPPAAVSGLQRWGLAVLLLVPAVTLAVSVTGSLLTLSLPPRVLPKMGFAADLPDDARTLVVTPCMLSSREEVESLLRGLEVDFLANPGRNLGFALLSDFLDAPRQEMPDDAELLRLAAAGVRELEARYGGRGDGRPRFFLLHRERRFNAAEGVWMGWERKRGKLAELNRLLAGASDTSFTDFAGDLPRFGPVRFVLTLDADTRLPRGSAARLAAILAHPLNRAELDADGRVAAGYTVLQPRVELTPESADRTRYARLFSGEAGLDLYTRAVSDVYQDLFGRGIYAGKGLYDPAVFEACLAGRVPENAILSHDLFEGLCGRAALVSDVVLFEDYPPHLLVAMRRLHRWVRGDWQLLPWLFPRVPASADRRRNRLPLIGLWMIADNLRRSLFAPSLVLLLAAGWLWLPGPAWIWAALAAGALAAPIFLGGLTATWRLVRGAAWQPTLVDAAWSVRGNAARAAAALAFLPYEAFMTVDAIVRTLWRLAVSRRHLLEWTTAAHAAARLGERPAAARFWREMAAAPVLAAVLGLLVAWLAPGRLGAALPFLVPWAVSPWLAAWMSRAPAEPAPALAPAEIRRLRRLARRTWHFYERFAGPEDHWLPPDNFQEEPGGAVAHRTSPTNIGMLLLSALAAYDFGYLSAEGLVTWLRSTLETLARLGGHPAGHLWNWYDTLHLSPLEPRYVSTVDSGNLAGALLVVARGCGELAALPPGPRPELWHGLADSVEVLGEVVEAVGAAGHRREAEAILSGLSSLRARIEAGAGAAAGWPALLAEVETRSLPAVKEGIAALAEASSPPLDDATFGELRGWTDSLHQQIAMIRRVLELPPEAAAALRQDLEELAAAAEERALRMDFGFLFDRGRQLFRIGYNASTGEPDPNHYDLLASEARVASLVAMARGDVPASHWLHLGRPFARVGRTTALLSWGGTMFEYLMPLLLTHAPEQTPLARSCRAAVARQIAFADQHGIPWGVSESCYAELDAHRVYRYRAFGVPGLGLKRDLGDRLVVAPYASLLALPVDPPAVSRNLGRLLGLRMLGRYGLYEAIDYGPAAAGPPRKPARVRSYMAHHQGMILVALDNFLNGGPMPRRFHSDPRIATVEMLLRERIPRYAPLREAPAATAEAEAAPRRGGGAVGSWRVPAGTEPPAAQVLSNGRYSVLITSRGGGSSRWNGRVLVRGEGGAALEPRGTWIYVEDLDAGEVWSAAGGPCPPPGPAEVHFAPHLAELRSRHLGLDVRVAVTVAPDDDLEVRRVRVADRSGRPRRLALTSYGEVALAPAAEDRRHPAFSRLFVESGWLPEAEALVFQRRPRSPAEEPLVLAHAMVPAVSGIQWETDRGRFLGRTGGPRRPAALTAGSPGLSGTAGSTLDPVLALRRRIDLPPGGEVEVAFLTAAAASRPAALAALGRHRTLDLVQTVFDQARLHAGPELRAAGLAADDARQVQELLSAVLQHPPALRPPPAVLAANRRGQPALWPHGISGDHPILLVRARSQEDAPLLREVLAAHSWWRKRRILVDLVILDEGSTVYDQPLRDWLDRELARTGGAEWRDRPGGVFVVRSALVEPEDRTLLEAVAGAVLDASRGRLGAQLQALRQPHEPDRLPDFVPIPSSPLTPEPTPPLPRPPDLAFDNGLGGFTAGDREYVVHLEPGSATPAPWINVVANPDFGFMASESGGGFTWAVNSAEGRLTPWRNDPVVDAPGEALYLRDEETGDIWTPTRLPAGQGEVCQTRHRAGSTTFLQRSHGLEQELTLFVPRDAPVKVAALRLANLWKRPRRVTATFYAEWVLGASRRATAPHVVSEYDAGAQVLLARCSYPAGGERTAFLAADRRPHGLTADRAEFLGRPVDRVRPAGLVRIGLAGAVGTGLDPCAALQIHFDLKPGETAEAHFLLGQGADRQEALRLVARFRDRAAVATARAAVEAFWEDLLGAVQVSTPEPELDVLANRWLLYQSLSCRIWGRSALYQSSGAFGFRDQLQDALSLLHAAPEIARGLILEAARHQFEEGDVLHWWHPPHDRGMRTRCSDDLLWLPYVAARYVAVTGDRRILAEEVPFRAGPRLLAGEAERYDRYPLSDAKGSLLEHCRRALRKGATAGPHGLPLIGSCDWNDGLNRVGLGGKGESVWLGWFLYAVVAEMAPLWDEPEEAAVWSRRAEALRKAIEETAWDGGWYLRAWYDDGTPLGSAGSAECEIDLIAQAWAALSGAAGPERARQALDAAWERLALPEDHLLLLLAPPFERGPKDPGYIKAYPPGVRENGGQYSHAAAWAGWACARLGDGDRAVAALRAIAPLYRAATPAGAALYRDEPYVVAADIYGVPPHTGRGGWSWYTGTAGWTWRLLIEGVLGLRRQAGVLEIDPCIPRIWPGWGAVLREGSATYHIRCENPDGAGHGVRELLLDGAPLAEPKLPLLDDGREHEVLVRLGKDPRDLNDLKDIKDEASPSPSLVV
ncbi:MAG TPA: glucoamylase family protein [Thermoanaerobaculia bacterium]